MSDDFNTALSTPLPEGVRRILLVISWPSFILLSIIIVIIAFARFYDSGFEYPDPSDPLSKYAGIAERQPDGTFKSALETMKWSVSNITPTTFLVIPFAVIGVFAARWLCFAAFPLIIGYILSVLRWVAAGFK
jgi:hypothetical protein